MQTSFISSNSELQRYFDQPILDIEDNDFNLLAWWKTQEPRCLVLSAMARDILTVPVSTVASEAAFSLGGRVISETRSSLNPETVEALICLKGWSLADSRRQEEECVTELEAEMKNLSISRASWIEDSSLDEE
ncbi:hypothetical protein Acr_04g0001470 [Actinidia rufa]|uniref:HAT C-terminal dimerisation domain-containing protein n=1 Tax=Actinidia rufa TaxID=165716 RepID=A0A7J0EHM7_9ERIC|nr:hypothetical protein Acr_04g0001470 [Actinidia rufa]